MPFIQAETDSSFLAMMNSIHQSLVLSVLLCAFSSTYAQQGGLQPDGVLPVELSESASGFFVENIGQVRDVLGNPCPGIRFLAAHRDLQVYLGKHEMSYVMARPVGSMSASRPAGFTKDATGRPVELSPRLFDLYRLDLEFIGANPDAIIEPDVAIPGYSTYYLSHLSLDGAHARHWSSVKYRDIYPGIDMVVTSLTAGLKYEFHVRPGADPSLIRMRYAGADRTVIAAGGLMVEHPFGMLREKRPHIHQANAKVDGGFMLRGDTISFALGRYDAGKVLVIDPEVTWNVLMGGSTHDACYAAAFCPDDAVVFTGYTWSQNFPISIGALQEKNADGLDIFITSFLSGGGVKWTTYYGGRADDIARSIAVDSSGNILVTGEGGGDFPSTSGPFTTASGGASELVVLKLRPDGTRLWATHFGGRMDESAWAVEAGIDGSVFIGGHTFSQNFPVSAGAFKSAFGSGEESEGFVIKLDPDGRRIWGTLFGGEDRDKVTAIGVLPGGDIAITGEHSSPNLPVTPGVFQYAQPGGKDAFIARLSGDGQPIWATYFGGRDLDDSYALDISDEGNIVIAGETFSSDLPTAPGVAQPSLAKDRDGFVALFTIDGRYLWSTYLGANGVDACLGVAINPCGGLVVIGATSSKDFLTTPGGLMSVPQGRTDAFVRELDGQGNIMWSTLYGGTGSDYGHAVAANDNGRIVAAGYVDNNGMQLLPGTSVMGTRGRNDAFMIGFQCTLVRAITGSGPFELCDGQSVTLDAGAGFQVYQWSTGETSRTITVTAPGRYTVRSTGASACCIQIGEIEVRPKLLVPDVRISCYCDSLLLDAGPGFQSYLWSNGATSPAIMVGEPGLYSLTAVDAGGCVLTWEKSLSPAPRAESIAIYPDRFQAAPGDLVSVTLDLPPGISASDCASGSAATIRFNAMLLAPAYIERGSIIGDRTENGDRFLTIIPVDTGEVSGVLLEFIAALGNAESTTLTLDAFGEGSCAGRDSGRVLSEFKLLDICYEGGTRFFNGAASTALKPGRPNPASGPTEIAFSLAESGRTSLTVFDMLGRAVATPVDAELNAGSHAITFDVSELPAGRYHCVLTTPSQILSEILVVEH